MRDLSRFLILPLMLGASGCATFLNSDIKTVAFGSVPAGAEVWIDGGSYGVTPISLDLNNHESHVVVFRREGYRDTTCNLTASVGTTWVVLDILLGLVPVIVDASTGAWRGIEQGACNVNMAPSTDLARDNGWVELQPEN